MSKLSAAFALVVVSTLIVSCGGGNQSGPASSSATTTPPKPPVAQAALANLVLTPAELDSLLGVTGSKSKEKIDKLGTDAPPSTATWKFPDECLYALGPVETPVYAGSGNTAVGGDDDITTLNNDSDFEVAQALVLFPSAKEANDFFTTSSQRWPACADRQFTMPASADLPEFSWKTGPLSNANGTLSVTVTNTVNFTSPPTVLVFQRALTVRNNVAIDIALMRKDPADFAVKVAGQIANKVDKQQ
jgi:hypothetical protein